MHVRRLVWETANPAGRERESSSLEPRRGRRLEAQGSDHCQMDGPVLTARESPGVRKSEPPRSLLASQSKSRHSRPAFSKARADGAVREGTPVVGRENK
jgi:hypothetical protein